MDGKYIKSKFKPFLIGIILTLIAQAVFFGFYRYSRSNYKDKDHIKNEVERCKRVVDKQEGNFNDFSYCKRYLEWIEQNVEEN